MPDSTATPAYPLPIAADASAPRSGLLARAWRVGRRRPAALVGALVVLLFVVMAVGAPWLAPSDPVRTDWSKIRKAPTWAHPFGTDDLGRDSLSRVRTLLTFGSPLDKTAFVFGLHGKDTRDLREKLAARQAIRLRKSEDQWQEWVRQQRDKAYVEYHLDDK